MSKLEKRCAQIFGKKNSLNKDEFCKLIQYQVHREAKYPLSIAISSYFAILDNDSLKLQNN